MKVILQVWLGVKNTLPFVQEQLPNSLMRYAARAPIIHQYNSKAYQ